MLHIDNKTPFSTHLFVSQDVNGDDHATIIVKATYTLPSSAGPVTLAESQLPVGLSDVHEDDDAEAHAPAPASDLSPPKAGTDVALIGHAYAPRRGTTEQQVGIWVGTVKKTVQVFGDRAWAGRAWAGRAWDLGMSSISAPRPYDRMPLSFERAYGGTDPHQTNPKKPNREDRNPLGLGFCTCEQGAHINGLRLPNLEQPQQLIKSIKDRPLPCALGFVAPGWRPRRDWAGTYDDSWSKSRKPLLPLDFDPRFYHSVSQDQIATPHLQGGEAVRLVGCTPGGDLQTALPKLQLQATFHLDGRPIEVPLVLDTVLLEPDESRLLLTYKASALCTRKLLYLDRIELRAVEL